MRPRSQGLHPAARTGGYRRGHPGGRGCAGRSWFDEDMHGLATATTLAGHPQPRPCSGSIRDGPPVAQGHRAAGSSSPDDMDPESSSPRASPEEVGLPRGSRVRTTFVTSARPVVRRVAARKRQRRRGSTKHAGKDDAGGIDVPEAHRLRWRTWLRRQELFSGSRRRAGISARLRFRPQADLAKPACRAEPSVTLPWRPGLVADVADGLVPSPSGRSAAGWAARALGGGGELTHLVLADGVTQSTKNRRPRSASTLLPLWLLETWLLVALTRRRGTARLVAGSGPAARNWTCWLQVQDQQESGRALQVVKTSWQEPDVAAQVVEDQQGNRACWLQVSRPGEGTARIGRWSRPGEGTAWWLQGQDHQQGTERVGLRWGQDQLRGNRTISTAVEDQAWNCGSCDHDGPGRSNHSGRLTTARR